METKKVVTYTRIACVKQDVMNPCQSQVDDMKTYCEKHNYEIISHYEDLGYSGSDFNRPQFKRFLRDLKNETIRPDILLCQMQHRFSRNLLESMKIIKTLKKFGVELKFTIESETMTGLFTVEFKAKIKRR